MVGFKWVKLSSAIGVSLLAGAIGSLFTFQAIPTWYETLNKPFFTPPNWIFGPVWTFLYILMGIALYLVWESKESIMGKRPAFFLFFTQLILNTLWSIFFFGRKSPELAFLDIILLLIVLFLTARTFYRISKTSGFLLLPYILWVTFATLLNFAIIILN